MQVSHKLSQTSKRWVFIYLFNLNELRKSEKNSEQKINAIEYETLCRASRSKKCKRKSLIIIEKLRQNKALNNSDFTLIKLIQSEANFHHSKLQVLTEQDNFNSVIDNDFIDGIVSDEKFVIKKLHDGYRIINSISPLWNKRIKGVLEIVSGIHDKENTINSGFTKDFPGFINFNTNCIDEVIGEQLVHESTHLLLDNLIFFNSSVRNFIQQFPPIYSIFAKKPRTFELVVHGLFSYTSVYIFWDNLMKYQLTDIKIAQKRKTEVTCYISDAVLNLNNILSDNDWIRLKKIYHNISPIDVDKLWSVKRKEVITNNQIFNSFKNHFNDLEIAEILLAIQGNKVSRVSKNVKNIGGLIEYLNKLNLYYCLSNYLFESKDEKINDFRNVISSTHNLDSVYNENLDIHIYLSNSKEKLLKAYYFDQNDMSGSLFGIPKCCQEFFKANWELAVKKFDGDLVKLLYAGKDFEIVENQLIYSPVAMYFEYGVCWHFTCKPLCISTKKIIDQRIKILKKFPYFKKKFTILQSSKVTFSKADGYKLIPT
jgi:hypothetical protein